MFRERRSFMIIRLTVNPLCSYNVFSPCGYIDTQLNRAIRCNQIVYYSKSWTNQTASHDRTPLRQLLESVLFVDSIDCCFCDWIEKWQSTWLHKWLWNCHKEKETEREKEKAKTRVGSSWKYVVHLKPASIVPNRSTPQVFRYYERPRCKGFELKLQPPYLSAADTIDWVVSYS